MRKLVNSMFSLLGGGLMVLSFAASSFAASYSSLMNKGYQTGSLTKNAAGTQGWIVSKDGERHFCRLKAKVAIINSSKLIGFTSSGRTVDLDRVTYEKSAGPIEGKVSKWSDLKKGRPEKRDVGACSKLK